MRQRMTPHEWWDDVQYSYKNAVQYLWDRIVFLFGGPFNWHDTQFFLRDGIRGMINRAGWAMHVYWLPLCHKCHCPYGFLWFMVDCKCRTRDKEVY